MGFPPMFNKKKSKLPKPSQPLKSFNWTKIPDVTIHLCFFSFSFAVAVEDSIRLYYVGPWSNGYQFHDRGSIPNVCQITDADLGQVG